MESNEYEYLLLTDIFQTRYGMEDAYHIQRGCIYDIS